MESIVAAFAFGSLLFWILAGTLFISLIAATESQSWVLMTCIFGVLALMFGPFLTAKLSVVALAGIIVGYLIIGVLWSGYKWKGSVNRILDKAKDSHNPEIYKRYLDPKNNKCDICCWMAGWPFSAFWTLTHDLLESIYDSLTGWYRALASSATTELEQLVEKRKQKEEEERKKKAE